jgi:uncharacterized protein
MHGGLVNWREWGEDAFAEAREKDRIILLDISAVWCHWCHVMDRTSYSDPEIAGIINEGFVPVRVDTDRMPDVNERYNMGGWPTTAFLTPTGEVLVGATYVPPDKLRETLHNLTEFYEKNRAELGDRIEELRLKKRHEIEEALKAKSGDLPGEVVEFVLGQIEAGYDIEHGGFGAEPKFPVPEALDLLLVAYSDTSMEEYLEMADKTMRGMASHGMYDHVMGGFFRYSVTRDWSVPHFEKMTESNAGLIVSFTNAYRLTRRDFYIDTVRRTLDYVDEWLWDSRGFFRGSQDADEKYYGLVLEERMKRKSPYVDDTLYTNFNAKMAVAYLTAWEALAGDCCVQKALSALDYSVGNMSKDGGYFHFMDTKPRRFGLLTDQVSMLRALVLAYQVTSDRKWLSRAIETAGFMERELWDSGGGGYYDFPHDPGALGALAYRTKPFLDNADAAYSLKTLAVLTGDGRLEEMAAGCLKSHAHDFVEYGYMASGYALSAGMVEGPVTEVVVVGKKDAEDTQGMIRAALSCYVPRRVFRVLYTGRDDVEIAQRGYSSGTGASAYVCRGSTCSARLDGPDGLVKELKRKTAESRTA